MAQKRKTIKSNFKKAKKNFPRNSKEPEADVSNLSDDLNSVSSESSDTEMEFSAASEEFSQEEELSEEEDIMLEGSDDFEGENTVLVTKDMVHDWEQRLQKENSLRALGLVLMSLKSAAAKVSSDKKSKDTVKYKYYVKDGPIFESFITMALANVPRVFAHHFEVPTLVTSDAIEQAQGSAKFKKLRPLLKSYLYSVLALAGSNLDSSMLVFILKQNAKIAKFACLFPGVAKKLLRLAVVDFAEHGKPEVRINSFIFVRHLVVCAPSIYLEKALRLIYSAYRRASNLTNVQTWELLSMMADCYCELLALDDDMAYKIGFTYIRELALTLRNAIAQKTKSSQEQVYSWPFINCLRLWSKYLSLSYSQRRSRDAKQLELLVYPLVQLTLGALKVLPTVRYLPYRFHCVRILMELQEATGIYIPLAASLVQVLSFSQIRHKGTPSSVKPIDFKFTIKVSKMYLGTLSFRESALEELHYLLLAYNAKMSSKVYYPEVAIPLLHALKSTTKHGFAVHKHSRLYQQLMKQIQTNMDMLVKKRQAMSSDLTPMAFERLDTNGDLPNLLWDQTDLGKHYISAVKVRATIDANTQASSNNEESVSNKRKANKTQANARGTSARKKQKKQKQQKQQKNSF